MADSKFLKWQDQDGDGLIDKCDDVVGEQPGCGDLACSPDPLAIAPDWKKRDINYPFLNKKTCEYNITKVTKHTTVGDTDERFKEFEKEAAEALLGYYNRNDSEPNVNKIIENFEYQKFFLSPRNKSRLKLLYSVPYDILEGMPPAPAEEDDEDEPGWMSEKYDAAAMSTKMIRVRKTLDLYNRYLKVYRAIDGGNLFYFDSGKIFDLESYGDGAIFSSSVLSDMLDGLDNFLSTYGMDLPGVGGWFDNFWGADSTVTDIEFVTDNYKLKKIRVWTTSCGEKPGVIKGKRLKPLKMQPAWRDQTAVAYLMQLFKMEQTASARVQMPWQEFLIKYTYPKIYTTLGDGLGGDGEQTTGSCIMEALDNEMKELGQDIMDEVFGIGDAVAYAFRNSICRNNAADVRKDLEQMGLEYAEFMEEGSGKHWAEAEEGLAKKDKTGMIGMATMQAFKELNQSDNIFTKICGQMLAKGIGIGPGIKRVDDIWEFGLEPLKLCGLFELLMGVIKCLLGGLNLEEALAVMISSALKAMSIENFGDLFLGLPVETQVELDAMVKKKLAEGDIFGEGSTGQQVSDSIEGKLEWKKPWTNKEIIDKERKNQQEGGVGGMGSVPREAPKSHAQSTRRTLAQQFTEASSGMDTDTIMGAYVEALVQYYKGNLLDLLDELNQFPGAQVIASVIATLDCPTAPLFNPNLLDWIMSHLQFPCSGINDITAIRFENPGKFWPWVVDLMRNLWEIIKWALIQALINILILIMVKLCEIIGDAICKALETMGTIAASLPAILSGRKLLSDVIRESICGPDADDDTIDDTIVELMSTFGVGGEAFADRDKILQFGEDLASTTTKRELADAFLGNPNQEFLEVVDQMIEFEYPEYRDALTGPNAIGTMLKNMGNLMPVDYRNQLAELAGSIPDNELMPANPTLCATPEQIDKFKELRCELLEGRATKEQCDVMYEEMRTGWLEDLGDISNILQLGLPAYIDSQMPKLVSAPGCDDGLIPAGLPIEAEAVVGASLANDLEMLKIDYSEDMLGNGNFWNSDSAWGFINEVLSDTEANPLTTHHRKAFNNNDYVDFATNIPNGGGGAMGFWTMFQRNHGFSTQHGQFPVYVASYMMRQFLNAGEGYFDWDTYQPSGGKIEWAGTDLSKKMQYSSHNRITKSKRFYIDFDEVQVNTFLSQDMSLLSLPDFGYNTGIGINWSTEKVVITKHERKGEKDSIGRLKGDITLDFKDNAGGMRHTGGRGKDGIDKKVRGYAHLWGDDNPESEWSYGFEVEAFISDIEEIKEPIYVTKKEMPGGTGAQTESSTIVGYKRTGKFANRKSDNTRVLIDEKLNTDANMESPLAELVGQDLEKSSAFPFPDWLAKVPIVGWVLEETIDLIMWPFSQLFRANPDLGNASSSEGDVYYFRKYEFLAEDDGLDGLRDEGGKLDLRQFPNFAAAFEGGSAYQPQVTLLAEIMGTSPAAEKAAHDETMTELFKNFAAIIGTNVSAWKYGADYDFLMPDDAMYVAPPGYDAEGKPYESISIWDAEEEEYRGPTNDDMILGMSLDQYRNHVRGTPDKARVIYLDPKKFGGSYNSPPIYVKHMDYDGWLGMVQAFFPEISPCNPSKTDLVDFGDIQAKINARLPQIPEDIRLRQDEECAVEVPFNRIMNRSAKAGIFGVIDAAIRIFASTHFIKAIGTFSAIAPKFPDNYSTIYSQYVVEVMEDSFKNAQPSFWEFFNSFKDEEFWYGFLETCVMYYAWMLDSGEIEDPPAAILEALGRLNTLQAVYPFAYWANYKDKWGHKVMGLWDAKSLGKAGWFEGIMSYREGENFETIMSAEEDAKMVMAELLNREMRWCADKILNNLASEGFIPKIYDLDFWVFTDQCNGSTLQVKGPEFIFQAAGLPDENSEDFPGPYYTGGGEFRVVRDDDNEDLYALGDVYVGYYHTHIDDEGDIIYMAGEYHDPEDPHDLLRPIASKIIVGTETQGKLVNPENRSDVQYSKAFVPLGDLPEYLSAPSEGKQFTLTKYISINGTKYAPSEAAAIINSNPNQNSLVSETYPGDMKLLYAPSREPGETTGRIIGIEGNLGIQYGLDFSYRGTTITTVEVDALDLPLAAFAPFEPNTKLLHCLLIQLKNDKMYKLLLNYVFPLKKITSLLAVYNDMGFLSSIGEVTVGRGDWNRWVPTGAFAESFLPASMVPNSRRGKDWMDNGIENIKAKPGSIAFIALEERTAPVPDPNWPENRSEDYECDFVWVNSGKSKVGGNEGWQHYRDRQPGMFGGWWVTEWDNWDRQLLRNSTSRIKKLFKSYYYARDWTPGDAGSSGAGSLWMTNLKAAIFPSPGRGILPWWRKNKIRGNPYDEDGNMCK